MPATPAADIGTELTSASTAAVMGTYSAGTFVVTVREVEGHIEASSPLRGRYMLLPRSPTEFLLEDTELRVSFQIGVDGGASGMKIWFEPDQPLELLRIK